MKMSEVDINMLSPMMKEYYKTKSEYMDVLLFYRLGDFYEMFFEDAITASHELELTLTGKNAGLKERVPMCGVPHHAVNVYLEKLIDKGYKVAICEQVEDPKTAKGIVKREVVEIVSKGTLTNTESLDETNYNFIGFITDYNYVYALSYLDLLSGKVYCTFISHDKEKLLSEIVSLSIKEIVVNSNFDNELILNLKKYNIFVSYYDKDTSNINRNKVSCLNDAKLENNTLKLISYITFNQKKEIKHLMDPVIVDSKMYLSLDKECIRNLELVETIRNKDKMYSLLWFLDKTKTSMGSRLLREFVLKPSVQLDEINHRHDLIELFNKEYLIRSELRDYFYQIYDLERLVGKVSINSLNGRDLLQLKSSLGVLPDINLCLESLHLDKLETFNDLYNLLEESIDLDAPITIKEGGIIKEGYNADLDTLKNIRKNGKDYISKFESEERERTGIKNLKVGYNKVFGYYIEVSKGQADNVKEEFGYIRKQTTSNSERYITEELKEREALILRSDERSIELESELFNEIRNICKEYASKLQKVAQIVSEIDMLIAFNIVAKTNNYVRPTFSLYDELEIVGGRHPVIEVNLDKPFIPNDLILYNNDKILLITGPNMSGKSTYMRQNAIIAIMAQMGSFVPATYAKLPIFDQIFTRIGSSDDIVSGESTFMTEMLEVNYALQNATERSLIILDEVGRGTATFDGMALAQAIIEHIHFVTKAKTLFSTHYHELTSLDQSLPFLKNVHVEANASNFDKTGELVFLHKVLDGPSDQSYGINVASLAKIPTDVTLRAQDLLEKLEAKSNIDQKTLSIENYHKPIVQVVEKNTKEADDVLNLLKSLNPDDMKPIDALVALSKLKAMVNEDE